MSANINPWLFVGAVLSAIAALLHLAIIVGGGAWYRFFGAGENFARMAEAGRWLPGLVTAGIAAVLLLWSTYALAGALGSAGLGTIALPWIKPALCLITTVYLLRGLALFPLWWMRPAQVDAFALWSSLICLGYGLVHLSGLLQTWERL
jgi:hypothetical protein